jgi:hypothetical protein
MRRPGTHRHRRLIDWGSKGRWFKSSRPDLVPGSTCWSFCQGNAFGDDPKNMKEIDETEPDWPPFDLARLRPEERQIWDADFSEPPDPESGDGPGVTLWAFGWICLLELWGVPKVVAEYMNEGNSARNLATYQENVRRARHGLPDPAPDAESD